MFIRFTDCVRYGPTVNTNITGGGFRILKKLPCKAVPPLLDLVVDSRVGKSALF